VRCTGGFLPALHDWLDGLSRSYDAHSPHLTNRYELLRLLSLRGPYDAAIALYESEGFVQVGDDDTTSSAFFTLVHMQKPLG
jgi:hypothetical protein